MPQALSLEGTVVAVAADRGHHFSKPPQDRIVLVEGHGVEGDAHAGPFVRHRYLARRQPSLANHRQVHLIPSELFASLSDAGFKVGAGDLGDNITTAGLDLERMPLGTLIELGPAAIVELTGLRTPCVLIDRFRAGLRRHVLSSAKTGPRLKCGVLGVVRSGEGSRLAIAREFGFLLSFVIYRLSRVDALVRTSKKCAGSGTARRSASSR
ncbi:MOSC domain-containing protein YiiM [Bradyrhizobium japonicum]|jgi:MOSC domain-containing protein YiiM|uniref:MOSC domain-containing protein n=1 Tax=Bradyrhizobium TaxID=374 RepID=UPI00041399DD|nr:MOSC domain-containing protein YiiM [Bradyrhizobium japonicum]